MKRLISLAVIFMAAALFSFSFVAVAQEPATVPSPAGTAKKEPARPIPDQPGVPYKQVRVLKGGNLALIAEKCGHRQTEWRTLATSNPQLPDPEKFGEMWRVWIKPDQVLILPVGWNYKTLDPEYVEPFPPAPKETPSPEGTARQGAGTDTGNGGSLWLLDSTIWELILLILLILAALAVLAAIAVQFIRRRDPSRYPAMVNGGLSADLDTAVRQIGIAYPGRQYERIERCRLVRDGGVSRIHVRRMAFGDGISHDVYLNPEDQVYRGTLPGGGFDYFLRSCGNLGPEFVLPIDWRVVVIQAQDIAAPAPAVITFAPTVTASVPAPTPEPEPALVPSESAEPPATEAKEAIEQTLTHNEVEVTVGGLLIKVVGKNGEIPATKIRTGDGTEVILQQP